MAVSLHPSLRMKTNLVLVALWLFSLITLRVFAGLVPVGFLGAGLLAGIVAGALQWTCLRADPEAFRSAQTAMEVRKAFRKTAWGRGYLVWFWGFGVAIVLVTIGTLPHYSLWDWFLTWATGLISFDLARDTLTLYPLSRLVNTENP